MWQTVTEQIQMKQYQHWLQCFHNTFYIIIINGVNGFAELTEIHFEIHSVRYYFGQN